MSKAVLLSVSQAELARGKILDEIINKRLTQRAGGSQLGLSVRQIKRLVKQYKREGVLGIASKHRGAQGRHQYSEDFKAQIKQVIIERYADFGPTFASEKLNECHQLKVSRETLRQWMLEWGAWKAKRQSRAVIHQLRERRSQFGELIQLDGSPHDWFEGRGVYCTLLVLIDDATSALVGLRFEPGETRAGYFRVVRDYIEKQGIPGTFYSDKYGVFRVNAVDSKSGTGETQFGRVCKTLGIELLCANTPQAKGRVERVNQTLQDRLVKELRLAGINDMAGANAFLPSYIAAHNKRFAVAPRESENAHQKLMLTANQMELIFSFHSQRVLSKNLELSYCNKIYQIQTQTKGYRLRGAKVDVCESLDKRITLLYQGEKLSYHCFEKALRPAPVVDAKILKRKLDNLKCVKSKPTSNHPWRRYAEKSVPIDTTCLIG